MSIALALLMQAVAPEGASPTPTRPAPSAYADPAAAVEAFRSVCFANWRDAAALHAAIAAQPAYVALPPRRDGKPGESWRAGGTILSYVPPGTAGMASPQCTLRGLLRGGADQLSFAARVAVALRLQGGTTRTGTGQAVTEWVAAGAHVIAGTRNAAAGGSELRLAILPASR